MSAGSRRIDLAAATPGARLALDVCDASGRVLMAAGTELSESALASLRKRGVSQLHIEVSMSEAELEACRQAAAQRLAHLFRRTQGNALMERLHDAVLAYRLEQLR